MHEHIKVNIEYKSIIFLDTIHVYCSLGLVSTLTKQVIIYVQKMVFKKN
jgi:hypothetical protein